MNCQQTRELLPAYLDYEVSTSERRLIQAHLAGCEACQRDLALLSQTRSLVSQSLSHRAAQAAPSPQAWSRLQARLADEAQRPSSRLMTWYKRSAPFALHAQSKSHGTPTMKIKFALSALALLLVMVAAVACIPTVRTTVRTQVNKFFYHDPSVPQPQPGYLSEFDDFPIVDNVWMNNGHFLCFTPSDVTSGATLPEGDAITVNSQPGKLNTNLSGVYTGAVFQDGQPSITISYTKANKLTWIDGGKKYEILSDLPVDELLKVAAKLAPSK